MKLLPLILGCLLFVSCTFTEEITVDAHGKIDYRYSINSEELGKEAHGNKEALKKFEPYVNKELSFAELFNMTEVLKAEASEKDKREMDQLNQFRDEFIAMDFAHMKFNMSKDDFGFTMIQRAENANEFNVNSDQLSRLMHKIKAAKKENANPIFDNQMENFSNFKLAYDGATFERIPNKQLLVAKEQVKAKDDKEENGSDLSSDLLNDMASMFKFKMKYSFPKAIKTTSLADVEFSSDRKVMTKKVGFSELLNDTSFESFSVTFE